MQWVFLGIAIVAEVAATSALKASNGFSQLVPSIVVVVGYALSFFLLSLALKTMSVGVCYAIWSGVGIVFISLIGYVAFHQTLDAPALVGMALIAAGVFVINAFSQSATH